MNEYKVGKNCQIPNLGNLYLEYFGYKTNGIFVEVGAFDCYMWSNTIGLAKAGWKGLYFEPQLEASNKCKKLHRTSSNIEVVRMALSDWLGTTDLYLGGSLSTIEKETKDIYMSLPGFQSTGLGKGQTERVPVSTLARELASRSWPREYDLLVIDVEGSEEKVLRGNNFNRYKPQMVIIETHDQYEDERLNRKALYIDTFLDLYGYTNIYADDINSIYTWTHLRN